MPHISSRSSSNFVLINGETSPAADIVARFQVADNGGPTDRCPEFTLSDPSGRAAHGHLTWDAEHRRNGSASPFFSVAAVRLEVKADGGCLMSVGTGEFVRFEAEPFDWVDRVQIAAAARDGASPRVVQWDLIELTMVSPDGATRTCGSTCLPRVVTAATPRRAAQAVPRRRAGVLQQYAEICADARSVSALRFRGQVTLRANDAAGGLAPLRPEDLAGAILVFTDRAPRRGNSKIR